MTANEKYSFWWRISHIPVAYVGYLIQFFHPVDLAVPYPRPAELPFWQVLGALVVLALVTAAALAGRRRFPYLPVGWLWYLGMLLPAIGLVQFGVQATADRFTYLPQIGLGIALAWGLADVCPAARPCGTRRVPATFPRWALSAAAVLAVIALTACAWHQTTFWQDNETLWTHALKCTSNNVLAHVNLGNELATQKRWAEATAEYDAALAVDPHCAEALNNAGRALAAQGRQEDAVGKYRAAIAADPDCAEACYNLAGILANRGRLDEAVAQYAEAVRLRPDRTQWYVDLAEAHCNLGVDLASSGQLGRAMAEYHQALRIKPDCAEALGSLAAAYAQSGRLPEAVAALRRALDLATQQGNRDLADRLRARLAQYEAVRPNPQPSPSPAPHRSNH